jgi:hypothetical protein
MQAQFPGRERTKRKKQGVKPTIHTTKGGWEESSFSLASLSSFLLDLARSKLKKKRRKKGRPRT